MRTVLHIDSSILGEQSHSRALSQQLVNGLQAQQPALQVIYRDLVADPLPHLNGERVAALFSDPATRTEAQQQVVTQADQLLNEVQQADALVIGLPMYNFHVPSQFKAWLDLLARAGVTFRYTENGPQGLLENTPVYVLAARGGLYAGTEHDHQTPFIKQFFGMLGLTDITFVYAEGLNLSPQQQADSLAAARQQIDELVSRISTAA